MTITKKQKQEHIEKLEKMTNRRHSQWRDVMRRLMRDKLAVVGLVIVVVLIFITLFAKVIAPYDYSAQDLTNKFQMPNAEYIMGTDNYGRDLFSRILVGGQISLLVALIAVVLALVVGGALGATAGYFGGIYEVIVMRLLDILMAISGLLLAVAVSAAFGTGTMNTALAVSIGNIPSSARILRATVLTIREQEYVEAARATGSTDLRIIMKHILPNTLAPLIVDTTLRIGGCIMQISGLSFVGLGVQPPTPEWGSILSSGREYVRDFWPLVIFPGAAIMLTMFGFNVLGDGLRDALDPKLKQ